MSFRDNLQYLRATRNMTQEQLAMLLGVSRQSVTKWEAERSYPEMDKLIKICRLFDCTLDDLVQGDLAQTAASAPGSPTVPAGPPQDVCGYDEHQRAMAWKVPTGIACILSAVGIAFLFEGALSLAEWNGKDSLFVLIVLAGVLAGLAFCVPAGMAHTAFVKKHPYTSRTSTPKRTVPAPARRSHAGSSPASALSSSESDASWPWPRTPRRKGSPSVC